MPPIKDCEYEGKDGICRYQGVSSMRCASWLMHYCPRIDYSIQNQIRRSKEEPGIVYVNLLSGMHGMPLGNALWFVLKQTGHIENGDDFSALIRSRSPILLDALLAVEQDREEIIWSYRFNDAGSTWWFHEHYDEDRYKHILSIVANSKYAAEHARDGAWKLLRKLKRPKAFIASRNKRGFRYKSNCLPCGHRAIDSQKEFDSLGAGGYIYVLNTELGFYKIGCSRRLTRRINTLQTQLPFKTNVELTVAVQYPYKTEKWLHSKFRSKRTHGEWFKLNEEDISWLHDWSHEAKMPISECLPLFALTEAD